MSRGRAIALRFIAVALLVVVACWASLWAFTEYKVHRAKSLLAEASRIQIGDSESSVLALVGRYGGFKWTPEPLKPREQWIDKDEFDYQTLQQSDYTYALGISPCGAAVASSLVDGLKRFALCGSAFQYVCARY